MRKGVSEQASDLLIIIYPVLEPDHLSYSDRDGDRESFRGRRGYSQRAEEPKQTFPVHPIGQCWTWPEPPGYTLSLTLLCPGPKLMSVVLPEVRLQGSREAMPWKGQLTVTNKQALNTKSLGCNVLNQH